MGIDFHGLMECLCTEEVLQKDQGEGGGQSNGLRFLLPAEIR